MCRRDAPYSRNTWADFRGLTIYLLSGYLFRPTPKITICPRISLRFGLRRCLCTTYTNVRAGSVSEASPGEPKIDRGKRGTIYLSSTLWVDQ